jgi:hypothetical protein
MRRMLFTTLACTALFVAVPVVALARNEHHHHHKRHHHARVRHEEFIGHHHAGEVGGGNPSDVNAPTAGTVTSFADNTLTITLTNGSVVSGDVTSDTEVRCENPAATSEAEHGDVVREDGPGGGDDGDRRDRGDDGGDAGMCTITPGMGVTQAELTINRAGASWNEVDLVSSTTTSTSQP